MDWWLIDLEFEPDVYYCNDHMVKVFGLDTRKAAHSLRETSPIAGDYIKYFEFKDTRQAGGKSRHGQRRWRHGSR